MHYAYPCLAKCMHTFHFMVFSPVPLFVEKQRTQGGIYDSLTQSDAYMRR